MILSQNKSIGLNLLRDALRYCNKMRQAFPERSPQAEYYRLGYCLLTALIGVIVRFHLKGD